MQRMLVNFPHLLQPTEDPPTAAAESGSRHRTTSLTLHLSLVWMELSEPLHLVSLVTLVLC